MRVFYGLRGTPNSESKRNEADPTLQGLLIATKSCIAFCEKLQRLPSLSHVCFYTFCSKFSEWIFGNVMSVVITQMIAKFISEKNYFFSTSRN